jgi:hypothetical protein
MWFTGVVWFAIFLFGSLAVKEVGGEECAKDVEPYRTQAFLAAVGKAEGFLDEGGVGFVRVYDKDIKTGLPTMYSLRSSTGRLYASRKEVLKELW